MNKKILFILLAILCFIILIGGILLFIFGNKKANEYQEMKKESKLPGFMLAMGFILFAGGFVGGASMIAGAKSYDKYGNKIE